MLNKLTKKKKIIIISALVIILSFLIYRASHIEKIKRVTKEETKEKNQITFENDSYTCEVNSSVSVIMKSSSKDFPNGVNVLSGDSSVATVDNSMGNPMDCFNCKLVNVKCKKTGDIELKAISNNETIATTKLIVNPEVEKIFFDQPYYTCEGNTVIEAVIKVEDNNAASPIKSIKLSDTNNYPTKVGGKTYQLYHVRIDEEVSSPATCKNCKKIRIMCFYPIDSRQGIPLEVETVNGTKAQTSIEVTPIRSQFRFEKRVYNCVGTGVNTNIITNGSTVTEVGIIKIPESAISSIYTKPEMATKEETPIYFDCRRGIVYAKDNQGNIIVADVVPDESFNIQKNMPQGVGPKK